MIHCSLVFLLALLCGSYGHEKNNHKSDRLPKIGKFTPTNEMTTTIVFNRKKEIHELDKNEENIIDAFEKEEIIIKENNVNENSNNNQPLYESNPDHASKWIQKGSNQSLKIPTTNESHHKNNFIESYSSNLYSLRPTNVFRCFWSTQKYENKILKQQQQTIETKKQLKHHYKSLPFCDNINDKYEGYNEFQILLSSLDRGLSVTKPATCHNFKCQIYFGSFSTLNLRKTFKNLNIFYQGDSTMNLFLKFFLGIIFGGKMVDEWADASLENGGYNWVDQVSRNNKKNKKNYFPDIKLLSGNFYSEKYHISIKLIKSPMCNPRYDFETNSKHLIKTSTDKSLSSQQQLMSSPNVILQFHSGLHLTHIGIPFTKRNPELFIDYYEKLTKCMNEIEKTWSNALIVPITIPWICSKAYTGLWEENYLKLLFGDKTFCDECLNDKTMKELEQPLACSATVMDERGARELYARQIRAYNQSPNVHMIDYFMQTFGRCDYTSKGDGRHFHGVMPKTARLLMHLVEIAHDRLQIPPPTHQSL